MMMRFALVALLAIALSACSPDPEPEIRDNSMSDAIAADRIANAKFRAVHSACEAAFERQVRADGRSVLEYQYGPMGPRATSTTTGWKVTIDATLTGTGRAVATCFTDSSYKVLDIQR